MVTCQGKRNFARINATEWSGTVESVEKSEILPPFPQLKDDGVDEEERVTSINIPVEETAIDAKILWNSIDGLDLLTSHLQLKEEYRK